MHSESLAAGRFVVLRALSLVRTLSRMFRATDGLLICNSQNARAVVSWLEHLM
jgi:hypothetical protein